MQPRLFRRNLLAYNLKTMADKEDSVIYRFAGFTVDPVRRQLLRDGAPVPLTSKALDTLLFLIDHHGSTVSKTELMNAVWNETAVEENNLTQQISALRRALGERPHDHRFIVTVPGRGYCFVAKFENDVVAAPRRRFDHAVLRGYAFALSYVLLVAFACAWSAFQDQSRPQSLAVMNFRATASGDEFIGSGISETLRARLGSVEDLVVRPAPQSVDALDAGRQLHVDTVVTGSVQRDQDRIRVVVEMVDVANGRIVWGKTFDSATTNVFTLQDAIAGEVATALNIRMSRSSLVHFSKLYI